MRKVTQLKAISTILKRIAIKNNHTCQEVQCMQASGGRIVACANDAAEVSAVAEALGKHGISANWEATLLPAFLAIYHSKKKIAGSPVSGLIANLWEDSDHLASLDALADYKPWRAKVAELKASKYFNVGGDDDDSVKTLLEQGYEAFNPAKGTGAALTTISASEKLELGGSGDLVICASATVGGTKVHAEQTLLIKLTEHLRNGGKPQAINIAGVKRPCSTCKQVLKRFAAAYATVYHQSVHYDTNNDQSERSDSPTIKLEPAEGGDAKYKLFRETYIGSDDWLNA